MVGDGPERSAVYYRAEQLGMNGNIVFVGKQANIADYLGVADVFLLPSELESFGLAALEALACEVPVIATRIGGIPDVVIHEETGLLCPARDALDLARAIGRLLSDDLLRRRLAANARAHVEANFTYQACARTYIRLYEDLLNSQ